MKSRRAETKTFKTISFRSSFYIFLLCLLTASLTVGSCKKDDEEEEETLPSMSGSLVFDLPVYACVGDRLTLSAKGISYPQESELSYIWTGPDVFDDTLRTKEITITIPDSLAVYTIKVTVSSEGYYAQTSTHNITSIDPEFGKSLTGIPVPARTMCDLRDGQNYFIEEIGNLRWFLQNLNYNGPDKDAGIGAGYARTDVMGQVMGRLYTWEQATGGQSGSGLGQGPKGLCPDGWSVPTDQDWEDLAKALNGGTSVPFIDNWTGLGQKVMVNAELNGQPVWPYSPNTTIENKFGWAALPAGSATNDFNNYSGIFQYGFWWSATEKNSTQANYRYIFYDQADFPVNFTDKNSFGASVRCVQLID